MFSSPDLSKNQLSRFPSTEAPLSSNSIFTHISSQPFTTAQAHSPNAYQRLQDFHSSASSRPSTYTSPANEICIDRFIPMRNDPVKKKLMFDLHDEPFPQLQEDSMSSKSFQNAAYRMLLEEQVLGLPRPVTNENCKDGNMLNQTRSPNRIFNYKNTNKDDRYSSSNGMQNLFFPFNYENEYLGHTNNNNHNIRKIPDKPFRVLEAPYLEDDYYLNLLEWSSSNVVAVALRDTIYLWSGLDGNISRLCQMDSYADLYTSVGWDPNGDFLATGISTGKIEIWDLHRRKIIRDDLEEHYGRVGCLAWGDNNVLASGSMDNNIQLRDMRIRGRNSTVMRLRGHRYEVCGLKWSPNNFQLASGGNDNKLFIWNIRKCMSEARFGDHKAAVKALTWSPHQNGLLLSGGGNNDKTIKFWNTLTMKSVKSIYTASQVCNLMFSKNSNEFVSTHGFNNNHVIIWKYPDLSKVAILEGHTSRVLYLGLSPDGETFVTGAGATDETLRFWNAFQPVPRQEASSLMPACNNLR